MDSSWCDSRLVLLSAEWLRLIILWEVPFIAAWSLYKENDEGWPNGEIALHSPGRLRKCMVYIWLREDDSAHLIGEKLFCTWSRAKRNIFGCFAFVYRSWPPDAPGTPAHLPTNPSWMIWNKSRTLPQRIPVHPPLPGRRQFLFRFNGEMPWLDFIRGLRYFWLRFMAILIPDCDWWSYVWEIFMSWGSPAILKRLMSFATTSIRGQKIEYPRKTHQAENKWILPG